ncbi:MAG: helix-turn-helix transcriptional regulator [Planctomycetaceae bacterium]|nr:helix-turn-helix transcriptional regulator [Planctomycetaceae bacterium]
MGVDKTSNHQDRQLLLGRIARYCQRKCISQQELAKKAGISRTFFSNLQREKVRWPQPNTLSKIASALDISAQELCDCDDEREVQLRLAKDDNSGAAQLDRRTNPVVAEVSQASPELFQGWETQDWDEIYSSFGVGGALTEEGVQEAAKRINEKRELLRKVQVIFETHQSEELVVLIENLYRSVQPAPEFYQSEVDVTQD